MTEGDTPQQYAGEDKPDSQIQSGGGNSGFPDGGPLPPDPSPLSDKLAQGEQYAGEDEPGPDANKKVQIPVAAAEDPYPDRVTDEDQAEAMARAEAPLRNDARDIFEAANLVDASAAPSNSHTIEIDDISKFQRDRKEATQRFVDKYGDHPGFEKADTSARYAHENQTSVSYAGYEVRDMRHKAESLKSKAGEIGEWAGILHKYPVSEEYEKAHPEFQFDPEGLRWLENEASNDFGAAEALEQLGKEVNGFNIRRGIKYQDLPLDFEISRKYAEHGPSPSMSLRELAETAARNRIWKEKDEATDDEVKAMLDNIDSEFKELIDNKQTTLGQLNEFYCKLLSEAYVEPLREWAQKAAIVIDDVKSGRASRPPEPEAAAA